MAASAWVPLAAAEISLLFTLALLTRLLRSRRPHLAAWTVALAMFTAGAGALWYGSAFGWSGAAFRVYYVCGALLGVPFLALGQVLLMVSRRAGAAAALVVLLFGAVAGFTLALAPFDAGVHLSGSALPNGAHVYGTLERVLVGVSNGVGSLVLVSGVVVSVARQWKTGPAARARCAGLALIVLGALAAGAGGTLTFLGRVGANAIGILVGVAIMYAGFLQAGRRVRIGRHTAP